MRHIAFLVSVCVLFTGCHHEEGPYTDYQYLLGKWRFIYSTKTTSNGYFNIIPPMTYELEFTSKHQIKEYRDGKCIQKVNLNSTLANFTGNRPSVGPINFYLDDGRHYLYVVSYDDNFDTAYVDSFYPYVDSDDASYMNWYVKE